MHTEMLQVFLQTLCMSSGMARIPAYIWFIIVYMKPCMFTYICIYTHRDEERERKRERTRETQREREREREREQERGTHTQTQSSRNI